MADFGTVPSWIDDSQSGWNNDFAEQQYIHTMPQSFDFASPVEYMSGVLPQYAPMMYYPCTYAVPDQRPPPTSDAAQHRGHLDNGVFIPTPLDLARGRINQAVHDARWHHDYVDNTAKAYTARAAFDKYFGKDTTKLLAWQDLCFFCGHNVEKMPTTIKLCKLFLRKKHINIFDFVTAVDNFMSTNNEDLAQSYTMTVESFANAKKLEQYTRDKGLICPAKVGRGNDLFRFMLAKWF